MKTILELSHIKARQYFLESQNYCNMQFPKYIDFKPVIEYWKIQCKLPPKTKRFCPLVLK